MEKIKVAELKKKDVSLELQAKYFVNNEGYPIDRFHLPQLTAEMYADYILSLPNADFAKLKNANKQFETASYYYKDKAAKELVAKDFGVSSKDLSFKDYTKNERWYLHYSTEDQILEEIIPYFTPSAREEIKSSLQLQNAYTIDVELMEMLWAFCVNVIKLNKAMLLGQVEQTVNFISRLRATIAVGNCTKADVFALKEHERILNEYMGDPETVEYLRQNNDEEVFLLSYEDGKDRLDFFRTYRNLYRAIGLDFTETKLWNKYTTVNALDYFKETEDIVKWRKSYNEEGIDYLQNNAITCNVCTAPKYTEVVVSKPKAEKVTITLKKGNIIRHVLYGIGDVIKVSKKNTRAVVRFGDTFRIFAPEFETYKGIVTKLA